VVTTYETLSADWAEMSGTRGQEKETKGTRGGRSGVCGAAGAKGKAGAGKAGAGAGDKAGKGGKEPAGPVPDATARTRFPCHWINWHRVVLDESHKIKGKSGMTRSVNALAGKRRWCVTGTPMNNAFEDLDGQFSFFGLGHFNAKFWSDIVGAPRGVRSFPPFFALFLVSSFLAPYAFSLVFSLCFYCSFFSLSLASTCYFC
jgi:hypothetical protein